MTITIKQALGFMLAMFMFVWLVALSIAVINNGSADQYRPAYHSSNSNSNYGSNYHSSYSPSYRPTPTNNAPTSSSSDSSCVTYDGDYTNDDC